MMYICIMGGESITITNQNGAISCGTFVISDACTWDQANNPTQNEFPCDFINGKWISRIS